MGVDALALFEESLHRFGAEHLSGEGRNWAADQNVELRNLRDGLDGVLQGDAAGEDRGETNLAVEAEAVMHGWAAEIGVDEQYANVALRQDTGEVDRDGGLALGWCGAGEKNNLRFTTGYREQERGAEGAESLGELGLRAR